MLVKPSLSTLTLTNGLRLHQFLGTKTTEANKSLKTDANAHSRFGHYFCSNLYGSAPRDPRGVKKSDFFFSQIKLLSFCEKIAPERHKL